MNIRVIAIPTAIADAVRSNGRSPGYGHPATTSLANGYGPCRHCLEDFRIGEENRVLFTYDAFQGLESLPLPGPVFIHEEECARYDEGAGFPRHARNHALTLFGYGRGRSYRAEERVAGGDVDAAIERLFARGDVDYVQVHDTDAGCFDFRIERAG